MRAPDIVRMAYAIISLLGAVANATIGIFAPSTYETFADASILFFGYCDMSTRGRSRSSSETVDPSARVGRMQL